MIHSISFFALIFWAPIFLHPKAVITVNNSLHQGFIIISIKIKEAIEIGEILKSWNKVRILNWGVYPNSIKSFSIPRNKLLVNIDYTILGNRFAIAFIQIHNIYQLGKLLKNFKFGWGDTQCGFISILQNYEVYGLSVKCFGCPNFLFIVIFISWLRNYEAMIRIPSGEKLFAKQIFAISVKLGQIREIKSSRKKILFFVFQN